MPRRLENPTFEQPNLQELVSSSRPKQEGIAIIWILATIIAFSVLGAAIVATYNVSLFGQVDTSLGLRAEAMAESGYRFLYSEYQNQSNEVQKNQLLDEIRFVDDATGKLFNIAPDGGGQFELDVTSYFYRVHTDHSAGPSLALKFIGNAGFSVPADEYLKIGTDETYYQYTGSPTTSTDTDGSTIYTFSVSPAIPATADYTTVRQVIQTSISSVGDGGTLTLGSGQGALFPPANGMFLITKQKIKANLPVETIVPYRYKYRNGDQLVNVQKGPHQSGFATIDSGSTLIEMARLLSVDSTGFAPDKASAMASETNNYRLALDIADASPGLKSYWSFDDAGAPGKDNYGTADATLEGGGVSTGTGKVGGGLEFDVSKTGYVETTFNPDLAIGSDQEFTVVFWVKPGADITTPQGLMGVYDSTGSYDFFIAIINNHFAWGLGSHREICSDTACATEDLPAATAEEWQHVAFVYDGTDVVLYVNGVKEYSMAHTGTATMPNYNIYLGAVYDVGTGSNIYGFTGSLDEVAVFNTALTFCEVSAIFHVPTTIPCNVACDEAGAVAFYPFNGNADDENGTYRNGSYDGTVVGATLAEDRCGLTDMAYSFDGNDRIATTFNPRTVIGNLQPFTVAFWAKPDQTDVFESILGVLDLPAPPGERFYIAVYYGEWLWGYGSDHGPFGTGQLPTVEADEWVHIGFVYDDVNDKVIIYKNGVEAHSRLNYLTTVGATGYIGDGIVGNYNIPIGARVREGGGRDNYFTGIIDEIIIWNQALTPAEMWDLYNGTKP